MELVSVIMPSFNSEAWISDSVWSVLNQRYKNLELIVVDDGSTDRTVAILDDISQNDTRLKLVSRCSCSGGPATPRNQAIEKSQGHYVAFIDSDDLWHERKLEQQVQVMEQYDLNFLSTLHTSFSGHAPSTNTTLKSAPAVKAQDHTSLIKKNWVVTSSSLVEKELFDRVRFNQAQAYIGVEDYLAWLYLHQDDNIKSAILMLPLVFYRLRADSLSFSKIAMARKIFYLLSQYQYRGKSLGLKKYYYFSTYAISALFARLKKTQN